MKNFIISAAVIVIFLVGASETFACSCLMTNEKTSKQVKTAYNQASAVFYGEVLEISREENSVIVKFRLASLWKGTAASEITVRTAENSAMCGFNFEIGKDYMVYAGGTDDALKTNLCTRTSSAYTDAKYLNKLKKPTVISTAVRKK